MLKNSECEISKKIKEKEAHKIILFNFAEFIDNIKFNSKNQESKINKAIIIYIASKEFIKVYLEKYNLNYSEINKIINNSGINLQSKKILLCEYINKNYKFYKKNEYGKKNQNIIKLEKKDQFYIKLNNDEKIYYFNDICLMDENIIKYMNIEPKSCFKLEYYNKEQYIFLFQKIGGNINVSVGKLNNENAFEFDFLFNTTKDIEYILNILNSKGKNEFEKFYLSNFIFKNRDFKGESKFSYFSPFFDDEYNIIGNAYKPVKEKNNCIIYNYKKSIINTIYFINYFNLPYYQKMAFDSGKFYYLISEKWINMFKTNNRIEEIKNRIIRKNDKNLNAIINLEQKNKKLFKKIIFKLISDNGDIFNDINDTNYFPSIAPEPEYSFIQDNGVNLYFYINFVLLEEGIHNLIFDINEKKANDIKKRNYYCKCFYDNEYIFIRLNKYFTQSDKIVFEVGNLENNVFKLIYLLIFNSESDMEYIKDIIKSLGAKNYFDSLIFNTENKVSLEGHTSEIGGVIYKYSKDCNKNMNHINIIYESNINSFINQLKPKNIPNSLKEVFSQVPKIGLKNIGATCYMNAIIQCFSQIEKFALYFIYHPHIYEVMKKNKRRDCFSISFKELIENLWSLDYMNLKNKYRKMNSNNEYYIPEKIKETLSKMNPLFQENYLNDPKDLVNFIIMQLHEELNIGSKLNNYQEMQNDEMSIYNYFCQACFQENKSIISDLFYSINGTMYECSKCHTKKYNFQIGFFYIFPLKEVRQYKIHRNQEQYELHIKNLMDNDILDYLSTQNLLYCYNIQNQNESVVTLNDCFLYNQKIEHMKDENAMYCSICQKTEDCVYQNYIMNPPEIMIIILNRGNGNKYNIKCEFNEYIDIGQFVKYSYNTQYKYKLIGIVINESESGVSEHFIAYCRSPIDDKWYSYNDDLCFPVNDLKNEAIDWGIPYILFYQNM